jgi:hypothetical protein
MAPTIDAAIPRPLYGPWYQPSDRPKNPASSEPASPTSVVTRTPPGRPGRSNLAAAPMRSPTSTIVTMCIT